MTKKTHFGFKEVDEQDKSAHVGGVFSSVAESYDIMNDAMSLGLHRVWKKILVELAGISQKDKVLDIASGTGDTAKIISKEYPETEIYMTDINMDMLSEGRNRAVDENFSSKIKKMNLIGAPYQIIIGKQTDGDILEFKEVGNESQKIKLKDIIKIIIEQKARN